MKYNTFYESEMNNGEWYVYIFNPSWDREFMAKWGSTDAPGYINSYHHMEDVFERAIEIDGNEPFLDDFKQFIMKELFNDRRK